jgi:hypothetical protein
MATTNRDIKYINRDFTDFRSRLIEYARTYFPQTYNDFTYTGPTGVVAYSDIYESDSTFPIS